MNTFKPNPNLIKTLQRSVQIEEILLAKAKEAAAHARSIAPVGKSKAGEHYKDMIEAVAGLENGRVMARVNANKFTSHFIEFGTIKMAPRAILRRAVEGIGLRLSAHRGR